MIVDGNNRGVLPMLDPDQQRQVFGKAMRAMLEKLQEALDATDQVMIGVHPQTHAELAGVCSNVTVSDAKRKIPVMPMRVGPNQAVIMLSVSF